MKMAESFRGLKETGVQHIDQAMKEEIEYFLRICWFLTAYEFVNQLPYNRGKIESICMQEIKYISFSSDFCLK